MNRIRHPSHRQPSDVLFWEDNAGEDIMTFFTFQIVNAIEIPWAESDDALLPLHGHGIGKLRSFLPVAREEFSGVFSEDSCQA